jgi:hypothetical protein
LLVGVLSLVGFLVTGFYRSRHVYTMFGAAANVLLGLYLDETATAARWARRAGSSLILVSPVLGLVAFVRDPRGGLGHAWFGSLPAFAVFGGTLLLLLAEAVARRPTRRRR